MELWTFVGAPSGTVVLNQLGTSGQKFEFRAPRRGPYKFCFHNKGHTPETIAFYVHVGHIPNEHDLAKDGKFKEKSYTLKPCYVKDLLLIILLVVICCSF